jgi:hypothetical protein
MADFCRSPQDLVAQGQNARRRLQDHEWNPATKRWKLSAAARARVQVRQAAQARIASLDMP